MVDSDISAASGATATFNKMFKYLNWANTVVLNVKNASVASDLSKDDLASAYNLGKNLR